MDAMRVIRRLLFVALIGGPCLAVSVGRPAARAVGLSAVALGDAAGAPDGRQADAPLYPACGAVQVSMSVDTNRSAVGDSAGWMVAEVAWSNRKGPDCSFRGFPDVVFSNENTGLELPTTASWRDEWPERWANLAWDPDGVHSGWSPPPI
jgi:hypothetical protein